MSLSPLPPSAEALLERMKQGARLWSSDGKLWLEVNRRAETVDGRAVRSMRLRHMLDSRERGLIAGKTLCELVLVKLNLPGRVRVNRQPKRRRTRRGCQEPK